MSGLVLAAAACVLCVVVFRQAKRDFKWMDDTQERLDREHEEFQALVRSYLDDAKARGIKPVAMYTRRVRK